jgi:hypothetical protein
MLIKPELHICESKGGNFWGQFGGNSQAAGKKELDQDEWE